jgi:Metallo-peptidase family M12
MSARGLQPCFGMWKALLPVPVAVAWVLSGCNPAPGDRYEVVIDPKVSAEDATSITTATYEWAGILDGRLKVGTVIRPCSGADREICVREGTASEIASLGAKADALAYTVRTDLDDRAEVVFLPRAGTRAIAHELGHAMGLEHTQTGTLMCADGSCAAVTPTCDDVAQWSSVRHARSAERSCPHGGWFVYTGK